MEDEDDDGESQRKRCKSASSESVSRSAKVEASSLVMKIASQFFESMVDGSWKESQTKVANVYVRCSEGRKMYVMVSVMAIS